LKEDPITALTAGGLTNLNDTRLTDSYSYVFDGQLGDLDYAFATSSLEDNVAGVTIWHINADEPRVLDYNEEFKSPGQIVSLYNDDAYRASDHDPVIVGLDLVGAPNLTNSTKVSNAADQQVMPDDLVTYTVTLRNFGTGDASAVVTDVLGSYYTVFDALDFTEGPSGTLTWSGTVTALQSMTLRFVTQVTVTGDLPTARTALSNTVRINDSVNAPYDVSDQQPPWLGGQRIFLPVVLRGF